MSRGHMRERAVSGSKHRKAVNDPPRPIVYREIGGRAFGKTSIAWDWIREQVDAGHHVHVLDQSGQRCFNPKDGCRVKPGEMI